jgi:hypothetical protein
MRRSIAALGLGLALCSLGALAPGAIAQGPSPEIPSAGPTGAVATPSGITTQLCITIVGSTPREGWTPEFLRQAISEGAVTITEIGIPPTCETFIAPTAPPEPTMVGASRAP